MATFINFITHNAAKLIFIAAGTIILTALAGAFYFFIYSYVANKRLRNPEKKHKIKLIMPRFACIILAIISLLCSLQLSNYTFVIGPISYMSQTWQTEYNYVFEDEIVHFTQEELNQNSNFTLYERTTDYFKYSMYFNKNFNGIINPESKNCEFVCFVDYIGKDKKLEKTDIIRGEVSTLTRNENLGFGMVSPKEISKTPFCFYGSTDKMEIIDITLSIFKKDRYNELGKLESQIDNYEPMDEIDERDFMYLEEHFTFDTKNPKLFKEYTHLLRH